MSHCNGITETPPLIRYNDSQKYPEEQIVQMDGNSISKKKTPQPMQNFSHQLFTIESNIIVGFDLQHFDKTIHTAEHLLRVSTTFKFRNNKSNKD